MPDTDDQLRRQGRADAAVLLVAKRFMPTVRLNDWARALDLTELDVQHAVERIKERAAARQPAPPTPISAPRVRGNLRGAILSAIHLAGGRIADDRGQCNSRVRALLGTELDIFQVSSALKYLEDHGFLTRDVRGKRTYAIALTNAEVG